MTCLQQAMAPCRQCRLHSRPDARQTLMARQHEWWERACRVCLRCCSRTAVSRSPFTTRTSTCSRCGTCWRLSLCLSDCAAWMPSREKQGGKLSIATTHRRLPVPAKEMQQDKFLM